MNLPSPIQKLESELLSEKQIELWIKRDDLIHPAISGNKWRKLKWNIEKAKDNKKSTVLTFGGAFSNHIAATAFACKQAGLKSIGVIRGEKVKPLNATLVKAQKDGMQLHFVSRAAYVLKKDDDFILGLRNQFGNFHLVPEGGANYYGVMGCMEIAKELDVQPDFFATSAGTGTTATGLLLSATQHQKVMVFSGLKGGEFLKDDIKHLINYTTYNSEDTDDILQHLNLITDYHFGGFAKITPELVEFANAFYRQFQIPLDLIYTSKLFYGLFDMIRKNHFKPHSKIVALHTG
ncbi:MAG: pyridoxal-phosphate dependent enzyme, partial [Bacteroidetes bacterium]|nr:pyridoxal-phosphate dependent enzyme [Bacteroidota bacterium]